MPVPYGININYLDYPMHMIWHNDICIQNNARKMGWYPQPMVGGNFPTWIQNHFPVFYFTKPFLAVPGTNGDKIITGL